jgi:hypothetical protein
MDTFTQRASSLLRACFSDGCQYEGSGEILFNGTVPSGAKLRELIGYGRSYTATLLVLKYCPSNRSLCVRLQCNSSTSTCPR